MQKSRRGKNSRARDKHEAAEINKNSHVTRINPSEKTSMAESMCETCLLFRTKKINLKTGK